VVRCYLRRPKSLEIFDNQPEVIRAKISTYRTINDMKRLEGHLKKCESVLVVGGGFLGSETARAAAKFGKVHNATVTQDFPESGNMGIVFPKFLSAYVRGRMLLLIAK
jgi:programmed cell death 8 (apoptosis-inducing factor)